jgi:hypothetical protein
LIHRKVGLQNDSKTQENHGLLRAKRPPDGFKPRFMITKQAFWLYNTLNNTKSIAC